MGVSTAMSLRRAWFAACAVAVTVCAHALTSDAIRLTGTAPLIWIGVFCATFAVGARPARQFRLWNGPRIISLLTGSQIAAHLVLGAAPWLVGITTAGGHHHHHDAAAMLDTRSVIVHMVAATLIGLLLRSGQRRLARFVRTVVALVRHVFARLTPVPILRRVVHADDAIAVVLIVGGSLPSRGPPLAGPA